MDIKSPTLEIVMNLKLTLAAFLLVPLALTACSKQEQAPASEQVDASAVASTDSEQLSPEQQAAIDAIDKPVMDEKNTDVPAEKANAPADAATPHEDVEAAAASQAH